MLRYRRWLPILLAILFLMCLQPATAEEEFDLSVDMPLGGIFTYNHWTRLDVTIHNNSQDAFFGVLTLDDDVELPSKESPYRKTVTLKAGETRIVPIDIPAVYLLRGEVQVRLVKGDQVVAKEKLNSLNPKGERTVGVISENSNAFHFLAMGSDQRIPQWTPFTVHLLEPEMLPEHSWILKNLDILAIAEVPQGRIKPEQIKAIKEWVNRGGVLILSGGSKSDYILSQFQDMLPVTSGEGEVRKDLSELRTLSGGYAPPVEAMTVYNRNYPYFTAEKCGAGVLIFANYDVTTEPMASWQYNRNLWQKVLLRSHALISIDDKNQLSPVDHSLISLSKFIPGVNMPKINWIIGIFVFYVLLIAPILYWVLKRKDRHIWAWGIIPLFAVILSLSVYLIGRTMIVQTNASYHVSRLFLLHPELAEVQTASSFLSVSGGDYQVRAKEGMLTVPINSGGEFLGAEDSLLMAEEDGGSTIVFHNVPYLSEKQTITSGLRTDIGAFASSLSVMNGRITGTVTNHTTFTLEQMYLDLGMQRIPLGAMQPGQTTRVDAEVEEYYIPEQMESHLPTDKVQTREEYIDQLKKSTSYVSTDRVRLVGVTSQQLKSVEVLFEGNEYYWNVLVQKIDLQPNETGTLIYPYGTTGVSLLEQKGFVEMSTPYMYDLIKGEATFALAINQTNIDVTRVEIPLDQSPYRPFVKEIFHSKSGKWRRLDREERVILAKEIGEYLNMEGQILIRFSNPTNQRLSLPQPYFQVEGVEKLS